MRIAVVTQSRGRVGGVETYLERVIPALAQQHEVAFWSANDDITSRGSIAVPPRVTVMTPGRKPGGPGDQLRAWQPDLLFTHGLDDAVLESEILRIAPAVVVAHNYHGVCLSSSKTMSWPTVQACDRRFSAACLALYFPRRCGGLSPVTMARLYRAQSVRLDSLKRAAAVVTLSAHMANEMLRNGVTREHVHIVRPFVSPLPERSRHSGSGEAPCRLLFLGRLERLKGVACLLVALRFVVERLKRPVRLIVAGEGGEHGALVAAAETLRAMDGRIDVRFAGWQDDAGRGRLFAESDALVVPSLWPEPFGLVGLEAAAAGVPAIAFATGGIPEWLHDGENGCLAPAAGARPEALADAIVRCVGTRETLDRLSAGARAASERWAIDEHVRGLELVFRSALREGAAPARAAGTPSQYA